MNLLLLIEAGRKILKFIKEAKEVFIVYAGKEINKSATFWRVTLYGTQAVIILGVCYKFNATPIYYRIASNDQGIFDDEDKILKQCGAGSFMSWSVLDGKNLRIKSVRGCVNKSDNCIDGNIKEHNSIYRIEHVVDPNTFQFITETREGAVATTNDIEEWRKYDTLYEIISNTNMPLDSIGITLVRDFKNDIIYAFTFSFVKGAAKNCKNPWSNLEDFGLKVKKYL